jgi:transmembrane sensor
MNLPPARRLARFVEPEVDERRVARAWARVGSARGRSWSWTLPALAVTAVAVAVLAVVVVRGHASAPTLSGMVIESGASQALTLPDGTTAALKPDTRLRFDRIEGSRVEATLDRGEATFDVRHSEVRTWTVHAAGFDILDRGTRFVVAVTTEGVRVRVESGSVVVSRAGSTEAPRALGAGESWASVTTVDVPAAPTALAPAPSTPPASEALAAAPAAPPTSPAAEHVTPLSPGPRELLETANAARLAGRTRDAAQAFDALRKGYRSDPRAGLAAFELGRLRLDALGDPAGAVEAFGDAMSLSPGAGFREDAEARRVEALDRMHDGRCPAARRAYLARYPGGLHAAAVGARCP